MINGIHLSTCSRACQADRTCVRLPCFQACLEAPQRAERPRIHKRTEACANHLGAMVIAMTAWAREQDVASADLAILIIEPPACDNYPRRQQASDCSQTSGFIFSIIHIGEPGTGPASPCPAVSSAAADASPSGRQDRAMACIPHPGQLAVTGAGWR